MRVTDETTTEDILRLLEEKCKHHDWYYLMADDASVHFRGIGEVRVINKLTDALIARGFEQDATEIVDRFKPKKKITN